MNNENFIAVISTKNEKKNKKIQNTQKAMEFWIWYNWRYKTRT